MKYAIACLTFMTERFSTQEFSVEIAQQLEADLKALLQGLEQGDEKAKRVIQRFLEGLIQNAEKKKRLAEFEQSTAEIFQKLATIEQGLKDENSKTQL